MGRGMEPGGPVISPPRTARTGAGTRIASAARWALRRWAPPLTLGLVLLALVEFVWLLRGGSPIVMVDYDRGHYMDAARRFLQSGTPYLPAEVSERFDYSLLTFLHPPIALLLMVPFSFLPDFLWYAIPVGIVAVSVLRWRPVRTVWPLIGLALAWPRTPSMLVVGNTDLWVAAFVALGCRFGWPAVLMALKPSLFPLAFVGARRRTWWLAAALLAIAAIPFGSLWIDWFNVVRHSPGDLAYSLLALPLVLLPLIAWLGRSDRGAERPPSTGTEAS